MRLPLILALVAVTSCYASSHDRVSEGAFEASEANPDTCAGTGTCVSKYHQPPRDYTLSDSLRCPHPEDACWVALEGGGR